MSLVSPIFVFFLFFLYSLYKQEVAQSAGGGGVEYTDCTSAEG